MTEYEYIELIRTLRSDLAFHSMNMFGIFTAYVLLVYFAGRQLSSIQATAITIVYTAFAFLPSMAASGTIDTLRDVVHSYSSSFPEIILNNIHPERVEVAALLLPSIYVLAWLSSVVYIWSVRHPKKE